MSQRLLLDISPASARSKGQARRRNESALSDDARKTQRNIARRERAKCKKTEKLEQQFSLVASNLFSDINMPADSARPSTQADSCPGRLQYASPYPSKDADLLPSFPTLTVFRAYASKTNRRALAQSSRYIAAQSKVQETKDPVREDAQRVEDVSASKARDTSEPQIFPEEQDLDAAGILFEVAKKHHPISSAMDSRTIPGESCDASSVDANRLCIRKCPVTTCPHHNDIGLGPVIERKRHVITHYEGNINFGTNSILYSLRWPSFVEAPATYFHNVKKLKRTIQKYHQWDLNAVQCWICFRNFDRSGYVEHLEGCIADVVELQALGLQEPSWDHHLVDAHSKHHRKQPAIKHYWPSLGCGDCYTDRCRCPNMQQMTERSAVDKP